jgi:hypothetical protein
MKKLVTTLVLSLLCHWAIAQCTVNANAVVGITLQCDNTQGQTNRSGVAYNPNFNLYYSVDAGSSGYPIETFDASGAPVADIPQGFDYRGLWWNPNTNKLDGNEYNGSAVSSQNLDGSGYPLGTTTLIFVGAQPDIQSDGDYDYTSNEIVYYNNGQYHRYDGTTNAFIGTVTITGLPVTTSNLNDNTAFYTGCSGKEYGMYDYVLKAFYFIDKATGAYVSTSTLPVSAPAAAQFQASYANGKLWLFNTTDYKWYSYEVLQACPAPPATITPSGTVTACSPGTVLLTANTGTGYIYQWKLNGMDIPGATLSTFTTTTSANYTIVVTENGCSQTSAATTVTFGAGPTVLINPMMYTEICQDETPFTITGGSSTSGASVVEWLKNNVTIPGSTDDTIHVTTSGTYAVVMAVNGCPDTAEVQIVVNPTPVPVIVQNGNVLSTTQTYFNYAWFYNGSFMGNNPTYTIGSSGNYTVEVWSIPNCIGTSAIFTPVSVANILIEDLKIYPNPSHGNFVISGHINNHGNKAMIKITDITGRMITEEEVPVKNGTIEKQVDLPQLSAGTYMLFITCDNERQVVPLTIN